MSAPWGPSLRPPTCQCHYTSENLFLAPASASPAPQTSPPGFIFRLDDAGAVCKCLSLSPQHFCPGSTWCTTKWQPGSQGQSKYLFGTQSDERLICFEGGSQRAGSRADHTPQLSEELGGAGALCELQIFFPWQTGERAFVPLKDQDTQ